MRVDFLEKSVDVIGRELFRIDLDSLSINNTLEGYGAHSEKSIIRKLLPSVLCHQLQLYPLGLSHHPGPPIPPPLLETFTGNAILPSVRANGLAARRPADQLLPAVFKNIKIDKEKSSSSIHEFRVDFLPILKDISELRGVVSAFLDNPTS